MANKADQQPTWTSKVTDALRKADDFMSFAQLQAATGADNNQLSATLHHLKNRRVVDAMEGDGSLWWYLTGEDTRQRAVEMRQPEPKGNRTRKPYTRKGKVQKGD